MIAGHETTAATLGFTLQMLGVHFSRSFSETPSFRAIQWNSVDSGYWPRIPFTRQGHWRRCDRCCGSAACRALVDLEFRNAPRNGRSEPSVDDVPKLQFVEQCFREALRLYSPVQGLTRDVAYDTLLNGHRVYQGERRGLAALSVVSRIAVFTRALHTNPEHLIRT